MGQRVIAWVRKFSGSFPNSIYKYTISYIEVNYSNTYYNLTMFFKSGSGTIQCFECNSMEDPRCHDPFNYSIYDHEMPPKRKGGCRGCCVKMVQFIGTGKYI